LKAGRIWFEAKFWTQKMLENVGFSKFWGNSFPIFSFKIYPINDTDFNFLNPNNAVSIIFPPVPARVPAPARV